MKKLILITGLLLATNVFALDETDEKPIPIFRSASLESVCIHGHVFLINKPSTGGRATQVFERVKVFEGHKSLPMRCEIIGAGKNVTARVIRREQD